MSGPRGEWRSISVTMLDGPDYRALSADARHTLLVARLSLGPTGIDVVPGWIYQLADRTGLSPEAQRVAWDAVVAAGWAYYDGVIAWVVRALEFEPGFSLDNVNHRKSVGNHVDAMPRTALVGSFVGRYAIWWNGSPMPSHPPPDATLQAWLAQHNVLPDQSSRPPQGHGDGTEMGAEGDPEGVAVPSVSVDSREERGVRSEERKEKTPPPPPARASVRDWLAEVSENETADDVATLTEAIRSVGGDPAVVVREFAAIASGKHAPKGQPVPVPLIAQAIRDMKLNREQFKARTLRVYVADLVGKGIVPSRAAPTAQDDDGVGEEVARALRAAESGGSARR